MIIDRTGLHSVLFPFLINIIVVITIIIFLKLGDVSYDEKVNNVYFSFVSYLSVFFFFFFNNSCVWVSSGMLLAPIRPSQLR